MPKEFWTGDRLEKLGRLIQRKSTSDIAKHFGQPKSEIKSICRQYGLKPQVPGKNIKKMPKEIKIITKGKNHKK